MIPTEYVPPPRQRGFDFQMAIEILLGVLLVAAFGTLWYVLR